MRLSLAKNWWALVVRGIAAVLFGVITFAWPGITLAALVIVFTAYSLVDGVVCIAGAIRAMGRHERWGVLLFGGLVGIAAAAVAVLMPSITVLAFVYLVAAWAILTGIFEVAAAIRLRKQITGEWLLAVSGIASVVFGILITFVPIAGALVIALWIGAYMLVFGLLLIALGFRLRSWKNHEGFSSHGQVTAPAH